MEPKLLSSPHGYDEMKELSSIPSVNKLVQFKLHELAETKEGIIRAFDEHGYWIEGGSLAECLRNVSPSTDASSVVQFLEYKRIQWIQKAPG